MRKTTLSKAVMRMLSLFTAFTMTFTSVDLTALAASGTDPAEPEETLESEVQDESVIPSGDDEDSDGIKEDEPGEPAEGDDEDSEGSEDPEEIIDEEAAEEPEEEPVSDETEITEEAAAEDAEEDPEALGDGFVQIKSDEMLVQDTYYYQHCSNNGYSYNFFMYIAVDQVCFYDENDSNYAELIIDNDAYYPAITDTDPDSADSCHIYKINVSVSKQGTDSGEHSFGLNLKGNDGSEYPDKSYTASGTFKTGYAHPESISSSNTRGAKAGGKVWVNSNCPGDAEYTSAKLVSGSDSYTASLEEFSTYSSGASTKWDDYDYDFGGTEVPSDYRPDIQVCLNYFWSYIAVPSNVPAGTYDVEYAEADGDTFTLEDALVVTELPLVTNYHTAYAGRYNCNPDTGYIAVVVYGDDIPADLAPKFYTDSKCTDLYAECEDGAFVSEDLGDGRIFKVNSLVEPLSRSRRNSI